ncbi:hypothetical protein J6590_060950 [Homalodisca vitripennis]|nr:hypothetical protein J6590_060950 [Homalodisca vitripennis]
MKSRSELAQDQGGSQGRATFVANYRKEETWILAYLKFAGATTSMLPRLGWLWREVPEITSRQHPSTQLCAGTGQVSSFLSPPVGSVKTKEVLKDEQLLSLTTGCIELLQTLQWNMVACCFLRTRLCITSGQ